MMNEVKFQTMTKEDLQIMMQEHNQLNPDRPVREDIKDALDRWAEIGLEPGGFLVAVLENNLMEALGRADSYNRATIFQICQYIYNELPHNCHGSPEIVQMWQARFRKADQ